MAFDNHQMNVSHIRPSWRIRPGHQVVGIIPHFYAGQWCTFTPALTIAISWDPTAKLVDQFAGSGADYLVAAPFSPKQIIDRIRAIVHHRTPFVVTSDYIGPDRRDGGRGTELPLIDVPNSLRAKVLGEYNFRLMSQAIEEKLIPTGINQNP